MFKLIKRWQKERDRKLELNEFEKNLYEILRYIYVKKENTHGKEGVLFTELTKAFSLNKEGLEKVLNHAEGNRLVDCYLSNIYSINGVGLNYILNYKKTKSDKTHNTLILIATITIAFSALVNIIDLNLQNSKIFDLILEYSIKIILGLIEGFLLIVLIGLIFLSLVKIKDFIFNLIKKRNAKKNKKDQALKLS